MIHSEIADRFITKMYPIPNGGSGAITMGHLLGVESDKCRLRVVKS
jgi:hypothetical protein